ncbi:hypothetical protein [Piscirickettsia litoralis]|uniref:Chemotaxis methyl-accepting receptor HlyB-like 4HB MCP domain-containing protein n=1 Tax=Piscirickettsia litoralis TaxID=1891921 RepID=A0ABX2ZYP1_9GAMM|nr:hypothetical protein [Piscirickettsia litoralis]ODN41734.1 hypothetical protein BGC07_00460 [Piscirickettsia litoralis]
MKLKANPFNKVSLKWKFASISLIFSIFLLAVSSFVTFELNEIHLDTVQVTQEYTPRAEQVGQLSQAILARKQTLSEYLRFGQQEKVNKIEKQNKNIYSRISDVENYKLNNEEKLLVEDIKKFKQRIYINI